MRVYLKEEGKKKSRARAGLLSAKQTPARPRGGWARAQHCSIALFLAQTAGAGPGAQPDVLQSGARGEWCFRHGGSSPCSPWCVSVGTCLLSCLPGSESLGQTERGAQGAGPGSQPASGPLSWSLHVPVPGSPLNGAGDNPRVSHGGGSPIPAVVTSLSPLLEMAAGSTRADTGPKSLCLLPQFPCLPRRQISALPEQLCRADGPLLAPCQNHLLEGYWTPSSSYGQDWGVWDPPDTPPSQRGRWCGRWSCCAMDGRTSHFRNRFTIRQIRAVVEALVTVTHLLRLPASPL